MDLVIVIQDFDPFRLRCPYIVEVIIRVYVVCIEALLQAHGLNNFTKLPKAKMGWITRCPVVYSIDNFISLLDTQKNDFPFFCIFFYAFQNRLLFSASPAKTIKFQRNKQIHFIPGMRKKNAKNKKKNF